MRDDFQGYFRIGVQLKNKNTGRYDTVYILKDHNKIIGIFSDTIFADRFWKKKYIPSGRREVLDNLDLYEGVET
jgi:hypothetical protein